MTEPEDQARPRLSCRAAELIVSPPAPEYFREHVARSADSWDPSTNPSGYIGVCLAENQLVWDLLEDKVTAPRSVPQSAFGYDRFIGSARFRERLAGFLGERVLGRAVRPEHVAVLAGAGSVLEILFYALGDPGDAVLVPTPSYAGFWLDLCTRDELAIIPVHCASRDGFRLTTDLLDAALESAERPVKALIYTNPNNPCGSVASPDEVETVLRWADTHRLHVVCDEVYALSVFGDRPFTSAAAVCPHLGDTTHIVWAFSKDFAASGLRCGVLVTENQALMQAVDTLAYWACCSGDTQHLLGEMITDRSWTDAYLSEMRRRLGAAFAAVRTALDSAGIPYLPAEAGFFLLLDLRTALEEASWEAEHTLWRRLLDEVGVNLTPGAACRIAEPGFMRMCFASVATDAAVEAVRRIGRVAGSHARRRPRSSEQGRKQESPAVVQEE